METRVRVGGKSHKPFLGAGFLKWAEGENEKAIAHNL